MAMPAVCKRKPIPAHVLLRTMEAAYTKLLLQRDELLIRVKELEQEIDNWKYDAAMIEWAEPWNAGNMNLRMTCRMTLNDAVAAQHSHNRDCGRLVQSDEDALADFMEVRGAVYVGFAGGEDAT